MKLRHKETGATLELEPIYGKYTSENGFECRCELIEHSLKGINAHWEDIEPHECGCGITKEHFSDLISMMLNISREMSELKRTVEEKL